MEIKIKNSYADFEVMERYVLRNTVYGQQMLRNSFVRSLLVSGLGAIAFGMLYGKEAALVFYTCLIPFFFVMRETILVKSRQRAYRKPVYAPYFTEFSISLNDEGIVTERETGRDEFSWVSLDHYELLPNHIIMVMGELGNFVIPNSVFADDEEKQQFIDIVESHIANNEMTV